MSEFIAATSGSSEHLQVTEHNFSSVLAGDVESVRERLIHALEKLDYRVLSEQPLIAKRSSGQVSSCSFNVLKCVKSLTIILKPLNPTSTLATFDYEILNSFVTKGDRQTIEREAEAIIAFATARPVTKTCASCGTNNSSDSRFCRVCGTPNVAGEPCELEVLRLTSGARVGHQSIVGAVISLIIVAALALPLIFLSSKGLKAGLTILIAGEFLAFCWLFYGMWTLHRTLNPGKDSQRTLGDVGRQAISASKAAALPPQFIQPSVTEGTTELLATPERERVAVPVKPQKADTAEMQG